MPIEDYFLNSPGLLSTDNHPDSISNRNRRYQDINSSTFSHGVQFQIPQFIYSGAPTLAPGGGAEVLPIGMLNNASAPSWFSNSGFTPNFSDDPFGQIKTLQNNTTSTTHPKRSDEKAHIPTSAPFDFDSYTVAPSPQPYTPTYQPTPSPLSPSDLSLFLASSGYLTSKQSNSPRYSEDSGNDGHIHTLPAPSPLGLPVYSASGFDLLSILARVATRSNPRVVLGPVDLTCSFVVVDVRRHDHPIVYCSPSFCRLTGYDEAEVLGRNCRFLQSPTGRVEKGETRVFTPHDAVVSMRKSLSADKECQTSLVNYRKDGSAFINLVTVVPIRGGVVGAPHDDGDVIFHVGFQVDLTEQPNTILENLKDGSYIVNYGSQPNLSLELTQPLSGASNAGPTIHKDRRSQAIRSTFSSKVLKKMLADPVFKHSIPISSSTTVPPPLSSTGVLVDEQESRGLNQPLHLLLLEACPDFIHVVSLKGNFLYVAPSVRRILGYEPDEMVGTSIADYAHPQDVIPLMRELKESSATGVNAVGGSSEGGTPAPSSGQVQIIPRAVDLLFRARTKAGVYVWVECRGRLHVEPGKGRKAIVLSGRAKEMPSLPWGTINRASGAAAAQVQADRGILSLKEGLTAKASENGFWGMMSTAAGGLLTFLVVGSAVTEVLGWSPEVLVGRGLASIVVGNATLGSFVEEETLQTYTMRCQMKKKNGKTVDVLVSLYRPTHDPTLRSSSKAMNAITPAPFVYQIRLVTASKSSIQSRASLSTTRSSPSHLHAPFVQVSHLPSENIFEELEVKRGSSWQYELQQLRFANQRYAEEIANLEAQVLSNVDKAGENPQQKILPSIKPAPPIRFTEDAHTREFSTSKDRIIPHRSYLPPPPWSTTDPTSHAWPAINHPPKSSGYTPPMSSLKRPWSDDDRSI